MAAAYGEVFTRFQNSVKKGRLAPHRILSGIVMRLDLRKVFVWLVSLSVVLVLYLIYNYVAETPEIKIDRGEKAADIVADVNLGRGEGEVGKIGAIGVEVVRNAKYVHRNENKEIDREFGFAELLHEEGAQWEIEKPFLNMFRRSFKCYITSDMGSVELEPDVTPPNPKNAMLSGNVVIRILSQNDSNEQGSTIYVDDIFFEGEKALFSTAGPVRFVNDNTEMLGKGFELIYNEQGDRVELLRINRLDSLRIRVPESNAVSSEKEGKAVVTAADSGQQSEKPPEIRAQVSQRKSGTKYRCTLDKNVLIESPKQVVFAYEQIVISNIFAGSGTSRRDSNSVKSAQQTVKPRVEAQPPEGFIDIVVTCDGGIIVRPMDSSGRIETTDELGRDDSLQAGQIPKEIQDVNDRPTFVAQKIDYEYSTSGLGKMAAVGPLELKFSVDDLIGDEPNQGLLPVTVTAKKSAMFSPASNRIVFEGDSRCTMVREVEGGQQTYILSAPKLAMDLRRDKGEESSGLDTDIKHVTADGGLVRLATVKTASEEILGGVELKCYRFDYDSDKRLFSATGPGLIVVDNSKIAEPGSKVARFSLQKPCYATIENFDTLEYSFKANRIVADGRDRRIHIGYVPIVEGQSGEVIKSTAGHIEANLIETANDRSELSSLAANGGVSYKDQDIQFEGGEMLYDANNSLITAQGDEFRSCLLNGAYVDGIIYNLKTGRYKATTRGGVLRMRR